jgi:hypothetical protein
VADDTTTTFRARATDAGGVSACSTTSLTYVEDSAAPAAPSITSTDSGSPANDNNPEVRGSVGGGAPVQVRLYENGSCSGSPDATGSVGQFTGGGITGDVANDSTTQFSARTVDQAGNESGCSNALSYVEDSTAPAIDITTPAEGATFSQRQAVNADFSCTDAGGSGVAGSADGCRGTVADGEAVGTLTLGARTFVVTARDNAGNTSEATRSYTVIPTTRIALACEPRALLVGQETTCEVTVRNDSSSASTPTGGVELASNSPGNAGSCTLAPSSPGAAACEIEYKPTAAGTGAHELTASYAGDAGNAPDSTTFTVDVAEVSITENRTLSFTGGVASLPINCPANGSNCEGTVELRSGAAPSGKLVAAKTRVLGKGKFKIRRGRRGSAKITLTRSARAQLKRKRKLKAHAVTRTKGPNGKTVRGTVGVNLKFRR